MSTDLKIAVIGQSAFSADFLRKLIARNYSVVGVFTIPDDEKTKREDVLATTAKEFGIPVFKFKRWRIKGQAIPEVVEQYRSVKANLNILPYCNQFIPMEVIEAPEHKSINYHPSLLPKHRGAASINWTLIEGDAEAGFTIFWTDDGLDTGPILLKRSCYVEPNDTIESLYTRFLFPEGIDGLVEAVHLISTGQAPRIVQSEQGASYEPILRGKEELCEIDFDKLQTARQLHNFIRGMDKVPGAWTILEYDGQIERVCVFGSSLYPVKTYGLPDVIRTIKVNGMSREAIVHDEGLLLFAKNDDLEQPINVTKIQFTASGKMIQASAYGSAEANAPDLVLSEDESRLQESIRDIWRAILSTDDVRKSTDFFFTGAGSMDVTRLVEEVRDLVGEGVELETEDVYMATQFDDFITMVVRRCRGEGSGSKRLPDDYVPVKLEANNMQISFPNQLFINNKFVNSSRTGYTMDSVNPTTEQVLCKVQVATKDDVDKAVRAAQKAFRSGSEWRRMDARDRGRLLYELADLMERHKQELATIETLDSGAVYTLAIKTHIGMSIEVFRYMAGWCDKIEGSIIPIRNSRPNRAVAHTVKKPIGVCGIITPWNYPLMMVAWKAAACLAAGNTLVLKPAQMCPLTALKWCELIVRAGFPPGVVNVLPGKGSECGQAICDHPGIRKLGFTGSTPIGKQIFRSCAENLTKVSLELGGKSPLIIFNDCEFDKAVRHAMSSVFFNKGENCIAAGRIFIEAAIHDRFVERVVEETRKMIIDDPMKRSTAHGPQNHLAHLIKLIEFCERGISDGAKLVYGGKRVPNHSGYFFMPTIFTDVTDDMYIAKEESFGPVMVISKFDNCDIDNVIRRANLTEYGLAAGVFTRDISKANKVADEIESGTCFINCYNKTDVAAPFGGVKHSGFGKDLGREALNEYMSTSCRIMEYTV